MGIRKDKFFRVNSVSQNFKKLKSYTKFIKKSLSLFHMLSFIYALFCSLVSSLDIHEQNFTCTPCTVCMLHVAHTFFT